MAVDSAPVLMERTQREEQAIEQVAHRLHQKFPQVDVRDIEATVDVQFHRFDNSRIRDYVPIFVERNAREELLAHAS